MTSTPTYTPLSREQKLLAEIIVQLGNVAEAIRSAASGQDSSNLMAQIAELQSELQTLAANNAALSQQLADANTLVSTLQTAATAASAGDITPDSISEVIAHLGIEVG